MTSLSPVVTELTVRNSLQSSFQVGKTLNLDGYGSTRPDLEQALIVDTGAQFLGPVTVGASKVTGNAHIAGLLETTQYGKIVANSFDVAGVITTASASTNLFAPEIHVAPIGDDLYGNGSLTNPYQTIAKAIFAAKNVVNPSIVLSSGTYEENVTLQSYANIIGQSATIIGNVVIDIPDDALYGGHICLQSLYIYGTVTIIGDVAYNIQILTCNINLENVDSIALAIVGRAEINAHLRDSTINVSFSGTLTNSAMVVNTGKVSIFNCSFGIECLVVARTYNVIAISSSGNMSYSNVFFQSGIEDEETKVTLLEVSSSFAINNSTFRLNLSGIYTIPGVPAVAVRVLGVHTYTLLQNVFNISKGTLEDVYAVDNPDTQSIIVTQGNVSFPSTAVGFSNPATVTTLTPF